MDEIEVNTQRLVKIIAVNPTLKALLVSGMKPNLQSTQAELGKKAGAALGAIPAVQYLASQMSEDDFALVVREAIKRLS